MQYTEYCCVLWIRFCLCVPVCVCVRVLWTIIKQKMRSKWDGHVILLEIKINQNNKSDYDFCDMRDVETVSNSYDAMEFNHLIWEAIFFDASFFSLLFVPFLHFQSIFDYVTRTGHVQFQKYMRIERSFIRACFGLGFGIEFYKYLSFVYGSKQKTIFLERTQFWMSLGKIYL